MAKEETEYSCCRNPNIERQTASTSETGLPQWEYMCHDCKSRFEVPVPHGPAEAKEIKCTRCGSSNIERVNVCTLELVEHAYG